MKTKKLVVSAALTMALLGGSSAFAAADSTNHGKLSAFENVKTSAVSTDEMNQVSGEFLWIPFLVKAAVVGVAGYYAFKPTPVYAPGRR